MAGTAIPLKQASETRDMDVNANINPVKPSAAQARRAALTKQAQVWVAQTFFGTLLKQMHDSPFRSEIFSGGRGGQAFSSLLDQHLTQRMAGGNTAAPLVRAIVNKIERTHPALFESQSESNPYRELNSNVRTHVAPAPRA